MRPPPPLLSFVCPMLFLALCLAAGPLHAEDSVSPTLTESEAETLLRQAQRASNPPGSYRSQSSRTSRTSTITTTTLTKRPASGPTLSRSDAVTVPKRHPEKSYVHVTIRNAEGTWQIYGKKALLMPRPIDIRKLTEAAREAKGVSPQEAMLASMDRDSRHLFEQAKQIATHTHFSGVRFVESDRPLVRVTKSLDADGQRAMRELAAEQVAKMKKQLPFAKRMLVGVAIGIMGGIDSQLPTREEFVVDPENKRVLSSKTYNADGKALTSRSSDDPVERIDDLPDETFALPEGAELIRPKNMGEAMELSLKLREEERKAAGRDDEADDDAK